MTEPRTQTPHRRINWIKSAGNLALGVWGVATFIALLGGIAWLAAAAGFVPVLSVHDELVFELPEATTEAGLARIIAIMETPVPWASHLPLKVEGKLLTHYSK